MGDSVHLGCGQIGISLYEEHVVTVSIRTGWDGSLCVGVADEDG